MDIQGFTVLLINKAITVPNSQKINHNAFIELVLSNLLVVLGSYLVNISKFNHFNHELIIFV